MTGVKFREAKFQDYEGIALLESTQSLASKSFEDWRRMWAGNPSYEELGPSWPIGWVLEDGDRIVGCVTNVPLAYTFQGRKLLVATGRGWAVDDQYRSYALMLMDEYFNQPNVDIFLNNTVNGKAAEAFNTFGSLPVPVGDWSSAAFAITRHRGFAESALRIKNLPLPALLSYPAGIALAVKDSLTAKPIPKTNITVALSNDFDERFDGMWQTLSQGAQVLMANRSRAALQWHFAAGIGTDKLWVLTAASGNTLAAYAVFQRRDEPKYGLKRMRMVDFQACERHHSHCAALMQRAYDECRSQGIHVLENVGCDMEKTRIFEQSAAYRRKLPGWSFFYLARDKKLARQLAEPGVWEPSSYDGDASL